MRRLNRIPIPLLFALAVAVGVAVVIIIQITVAPPPPAVVAPIETSATSLDTDSYTYSTSVTVESGAYAIYPTVAGLGKLELKANTTGWYYYKGSMFATVVRRSTGNATFTVGSYKVYVREINDTHAFVFYDGAAPVGVAAVKVKVGATGWIVYHPVATEFDTSVLSTITNLIKATGKTYMDVFQPRADYLTYSSSNSQYVIYIDRVDSNGVVTRKPSSVFYVIQLSDMQSLAVNTPVVVDNRVKIDTSNYVLFPVFVLLYYQPTSSTNSALTITPVQ
jgi:hypothetical protein